MDQAPQGNTRVPEEVAVQRPSLLWVLLLQLLFWATATDLAGVEPQPWHDPTLVHEHGSAAALPSGEQARSLRPSENLLLHEGPGRLAAWIPAVFAALLSCTLLRYCFACILAPLLASSPTRHPLAPRAPPCSPLPG